MGRASELRARLAPVSWLWSGYGRTDLVVGLQARRGRVPVAAATTAAAAATACGRRHCRHRCRQSLETDAPCRRRWAGRRCSASWRRRRCGTAWLSLEPRRHSASLCALRREARKGTAAARAGSKGCARRCAFATALALQSLLQLYAGYIKPVLGATAVVGAVLAAGTSLAAALGFVPTALAEAANGGSYAGTGAAKAATLVTVSAAVVAACTVPRVRLGPLPSTLFYMCSLLVTVRVFGTYWVSAGGGGAMGGRAVDMRPPPCGGCKCGEC